jgi:hypothetical protein
VKHGHSDANSELIANPNLDEAAAEQFNEECNFDDGSSELLPSMYCNYLESMA